jgi:hypothetical protein
MLQTHVVLAIAEGSLATMPDAMQRLESCPGEDGDNDRKSCNSERRIHASENYMLRFPKICANPNP